MKHREEYSETRGYTEEQGKEGSSNNRDLSLAWSGCNCVRNIFLIKRVLPGCRNLVILRSKSLYRSRKLFKGGVCRRLHRGRRFFGWGICWLCGRQQSQFFGRHCKEVAELLGIIGRREDFSTFPASNSEISYSKGFCYSCLGPGALFALVAQPDIRNSFVRLLHGVSFCFKLNKCFLGIRAL
jgi:hypothetical protein